jgi:uncharacterized C2H2 Zn-finger protein
MADQEPEEFFNCDRCQTSFDSQQHLNRHTKAIHEIRVQFPEQLYFELIGGVQEPMLLCHRALGIVVCGDCRYAVLPSSIPSHLKLHPSANNENFKAQVQRALAALDPPPLDMAGVVIQLNELKRIDPKPVPFVGFEVTEGLKCSTCGAYFGSQPTYSRHTHLDQSKIPEPLPVAVQTFYKSNELRPFFFEVQRPVAAPRKYL